MDKKGHLQYDKRWVELKLSRYQKGASKQPSSKYLEWLVYAIVLYILYQMIRGLK